jgi:hypothetical protein
MRGCRIAAPEPPSLTHWQAWHQAYDDPTSSQSRRLVHVRAAIGAALDESPPGRIRLLSVCAGDGRDLLGVLERHGRAGDVSGVLVDQDEGLVAAGRAGVATRGLTGVRFEVGDAGNGRWYAEARPAQVVVACGVFGNVSEGDLRRTVRTLASVVATGGSVVWTRHRRPPDQTPAIRRWFDEDGFEEVTFEAVAGSLATVARHRRRDGGPLPADVPPRVFAFVGDGAAGHL